MQRDLAQLEAVNGHVLYPEHPDWPTKLDDLNEGAPAALWVRGQLKQAPSVAIVGARASSNAGNNLARDVAFELAQRGISYFVAFGIDAAARKGALAAGQSQSWPEGPQTSIQNPTSICSIRFWNPAQ